MTLRSVPAGHDGKPLWERTRLPIQPDRGEEKKDAKLDFRCTKGQYRALLRIVQKEQMPEIDSLSDCCVAGVLLFLDYYARVRAGGTPDSEIKLLLIDQEIAARNSFRDRILANLYSLTGELEECHREGWNDQFLAAYQNVCDIRAYVSDEKLRTEANKLYAKWAADASAIKTKKKP